MNSHDLHGFARGYQGVLALLRHVFGSVRTASNKTLTTHLYFDPLVHLVAITVFVQIGCATTPQCAERFGDDPADVRMSVRPSSRVLDHQEHERQERVRPVPSASQSGMADPFK